ncbi:hypothetical protein BOG92_050200 [Streptomyces sp. WAC00263]|nr:hypothetical protein BOG92_050200 [Streptomyces sp. WAC00263]
MINVDEELMSLLRGVSASGGVAEGRAQAPWRASPRPLFTGSALLQRGRRWPLDVPAQIGESEQRSRA